MPEFKYTNNPDPQQESFISKFLNNRLRANQIGLVWLGGAFLLAFLAMSFGYEVALSTIIMISLLQLGWHVFCFLKIRKTPVCTARTVWSVVLGLIIAIGTISIFMVMNMASNYS